MKKIFISIFVVLVCCVSAFAEIHHSVNFNDNNYVFKYSAKMSNGAYMNEYYLPAEKYKTWTKLVGVFDYPNSKDPIVAADLFYRSLKSKGTSGQIWINEEKNSAVISFVIFSGGGDAPLNAEMNFFKYQKSAKNGTIALQYAERHVINTDAELQKFGTYMKIQIPKISNIMTNASIPKIVEREVDLGK